jgi:hypothetical protein
MYGQVVVGLKQVCGLDRKAILTKEIASGVVE